MQRALPLLLAAAGVSAAVTGCAPRLSDDMFRLDGIDPVDRLAIEQDRGLVPTGGTTTLVRQPRFVYLRGALVDTNSARWYWIPGGPLAPVPSREAVPAIPPTDKPERPEWAP